MNSTFRIFSYGVYDYKNAEKLLNNMAEKGYKFKTTGKGWHKDVAWFEKSEDAKNIQYGVDVRCELKADEKEAYYGLYNDIGWKNVDCYKNKLHIFENTSYKVKPLYTDPMSEFENFKVALKEDTPSVKRILCILFAILLFCLFYTMGTSEIDRLACYSLMFILCLQIAVECVRLLGDYFYKNQCATLLKEKRMMIENKVAKELNFYEAILNTIITVVFWIVPLILYIDILKEEWIYNSQQLNIPIVTYFLIFLGLVISLPAKVVLTYKIFMKPDKDIYRILSNVSAVLYGYGLFPIFVQMYYKY